MKEVDPKSTSRALAFELWMKAPMPMVTLMKTLDVTALVAEAGLQIQYAPVLVHRKGGSGDGGLLPASGGGQPDAV